jgi:hypothetical protein
MARDYAKTIGHLIACAEDESLPEAARASYREKAEAMMREYRIEEEQAIATESTAAVPVMDHITIMERWAYTNPLRQFYWGMWSRIANHCGVRSHGKYTAWDGDDSQLVAHVVGYEGDIRYAELLFTAARLVFMTRIDARVDRSLSDQENCYYMRNSGMKRNEIARMLWGSAPTDGAAHGRVQKMYMAECAKRGETPRVSGRGIQVDVYREAYAQGFVEQLGYRLQTASEAVDKASGGLVLHGRKERVDKAFYAEFPSARPMSDEEAAKYWEQQAEEEANCADCKKTTSKTGKCRRHRPTEVTQAQIRRSNRKYFSPEAQAGRRSGERAAADVHIGRTGTPATRKTESAPTQTALGG